MAIEGIKGAIGYAVDKVTGAFLDEIGSRAVEEQIVGNVTLYGLYDRTTGERIGEQMSAVRDGIASKSWFDKPTSLRLKVRKGFGLEREIEK